MFDTAWARLAEGAAPGRSPWSFAQLATVTADGAPRVRTVVVRHADRKTRRLHVYTDARSPKVAEISHESRVALVGHDVEAGLQVRVEGVARIVTSGPAHAAAWEASKAASRALYGLPHAPGTPLAAPVAGAPGAPVDGAARFAVLEVDVDRLDALHLAAEGQRRIAFAWTDAGWAGGWIAP